MRAWLALSSVLAALFVTTEVYAQSPEFITPLGVVGQSGA